MLKSSLKIAFKVALRRKFFTFVSLFGISLTLVVLMVASAVLDHLFAARPPEIRFDRTLGIYQLKLTGPTATASGFPGYAFLDRYARDLPGVQETSIFQVQQVASSFVDGDKIESYLKRTDGAFWRILDFRFLEGRPLTDEDIENAHFVAVINQATRERFFGGAAAVGRELTVDGQTFRVVGVVEDVPILRLVPFADIWVPSTTAKSSNYRRDFQGSSIGLLLARDSADFGEIKAELASRLRGAESPDPREYDTVHAAAESPFELAARLTFGDRAGGASTGLLRAVLAVAALLFMLLPAVNLINLNLSRILERAAEIGVRKAFGASSWALVGQLVVENLALTLAGGAVGFALSGAALAALNASGLIPYAHFALDLRIFLYGLALALVFGLVSGVYPAWRMSRLHPVEALQGRGA